MDFGVVLDGGMKVDMRLVKARKDAISAPSRIGTEQSLRHLENCTVYQLFSAFWNTTANLTPCFTLQSRHLPHQIPKLHAVLLGQRRTARYLDLSHVRSVEPVERAKFRHDLHHTRIPSGPKAQPTRRSPAPASGLLVALSDHSPVISRSTACITCCAVYGF